MKKKTKQKIRLTTTIATTTTEFHQFVKKWILERRKHDQKSSKPKHPDAVYGFAVNVWKKGFKLGKITWLAKHKARTGVCRPLCLQGTKVSPKSLLRKEERLIALHSAPDGLILSAVSRYLLEKIDSSFSRHSYGNRPAIKGRKIKYNHIGALNEFRELAYGTYPYVVKLDIVDFYGTIPHDKLEKALNQERFGLSKDVIRFIKNYLVSVEKIYGQKKGLLQGSPISGILANLYLDHLDRSLSQARIHFVRYTDDVTLFAKTETKAINAEKLATEILSKLGLKVSQDENKKQYACFLSLNSTSSNNSKKIEHPVDWKDDIDLLGFSFNKDKSFRIRQKTMEKAKKRIQFISSFDQGAKSKTPHLKKSIAKVNLFLGYDYARKSRPSLGHFRIAPKGSHVTGFIRYFASLGFSDAIMAQMKVLDCLIRGRLHGLNKKIAEVNSEVGAPVDFSELGLRTAQAIYKIKTSPSHSPSP